MSFVRRGLCSLLYHWKNTGALLVIYFLSSVLVLVGLNIRQACQAAADAVGQEVGAHISVTNTYQASSFLAEERNNIPLNLVNKLSKLPGVSGVDYTVSLSAKSKGFSSVSMAGEDGKAPLLLLGSLDSSQMELFSSQGAELAVGRHMTGEDRGCALVSLSLAEENRWDLKSTFSVTDSQGREVPLGIVGIYLPGEGTGPEEGLGISWENTVIICAEDGLDLLGNNQVSQVVLELEDPARAHEIAVSAEEILDVSPPEGGEYVVRVDNGDYLQIAGPLQRMVSLMFLMAGAAMLLGAAILFLLSLLSLKARDREVGILLSLGEKKGKIFLQMLLELSLPMFVAVVGAALAGGPLSRWLAILAGVESGAVNGVQIALVCLAGLVLTMMAAVPVMWKVITFSPVKMLREE